MLPSQPAGASLVASLAEVQAWPPGLGPGCPGMGCPRVTGEACCSPASPAQRPYDIHSSSAVESLVQLFSTVSVQYVPAWSKETVALLRKVSARPARSAGWRTRGAGRQPAAPGRGRRPARASWAACPSPPGLLAWPGPGSLSCRSSACVSAGAAVSPYDLIKASRPLPSLTPQLRASHSSVCRGGGQGLVPLRPGSSCRRWAATVHCQWPGQPPHQKQAGKTPEPPACPGPRAHVCSTPGDSACTDLRWWCCSWCSPPGVQGWAGVTPRPAS